MRNALVIIMHLLIFAAAYGVFTVGLGIGLQKDPTIGSILWVVAVLIAVGNLVWLILSIRKMCRA